MPVDSRRTGVPRSRAKTRTLPTLVAIAALGGLSLPALALAMVKPADGANGKFTFSGELGGTVKLPSKWNIGYGDLEAGCQKTVDPTDFNILFYNVKLRLNGHETVLAGSDGNVDQPIIFGLSVRQYGDTESFANQASPSGSPDFPASADINLWAGHTAYDWETNAGSATVVSSGTITTNARGTSGSLSATLVPVGTGLPAGVEGHETATVTIKGSWTSCAKPEKA